MDPGAPAGNPPGGDYESYMAGELTKQVCCIKYSLMACNAFGIMLGIFVVLFGISYPEENFPGGYKGKETAGISGFFIIFTLIGYYGAHRQKIYFLIPYSVIIFFFLGGNLLMWGISKEDSVLDPDSNAVLVLTGVFVILMVFALWLAWQERKKAVGNVTVQSSVNNYPLTTTMTTTAAPPVISSQPLSQTTQLSNTTQLNNQLNNQLSNQLNNQQQTSSGQSSQPRSPRSAQQSVTFGPYGPRPGFIPFDIDSKPTSNSPYLNVFYQPESNSYVTLPVRQGGYGSQRADQRNNNVMSGGFLSGGPLLMW
jgi:hypothetical protein